MLRRERTRVWLALSLAVALCVVHSMVDIDWDFLAVLGPSFLPLGRSCPVTSRGLDHWAPLAHLGCRGRLCGRGAFSGGLAVARGEPRLSLTRRLTSELGRRERMRCRRGRSIRCRSTRSSRRLWSSGTPEALTLYRKAVDPSRRTRRPGTSRLLRADELAPPALRTRPESRIHARPQHLGPGLPGRASIRPAVRSTRLRPKMSTRCAPGS